MAVVLKSMFQGYKWIFEELADPRADNILCISPIRPALIILAYWYFVQKAGPRFMKNREAFNLKPVLILYNGIQVLCNFYLFCKSLKLIRNHNLTCATVDYSKNERAMEELLVAEFYLYLKVSDLLDTVFFVLRKKQNQVSFLHVYHHCGMILLAFIGNKFVPGGQSLMVPLINCLVHTIMYFYYLLNIIDEKYKKNIWWKKHVTQIQLIQFMIFIFFYGRVLFLDDCTYPKFLCYLFVPQNMFMLCLFGDFYFRTYIRKKTKAE